MKIKPQPELVATLTSREIQIIKLICKGYGNKQIGKEMGYMTRSIEDFRLIMQKKIKLKKPALITIFAIKNGIIKI